MVLTTIIEIKNRRNRADKEAYWIEMIIIGEAFDVLIWCITQCSFQCIVVHIFGK